MGDLIYPKARISIGGGDLQDVTNLKTMSTNNSKQVHTILQQGAGVTEGVKESTVSWDSVISQEGFERDYVNLLDTAVIFQLRVKLPGVTLTYEGVLVSLDVEGPLDDSIKLSCSFVGSKLE